MTNHELDLKFGTVVKSERKITREVLELIRLAEHRRLPQELGFRDTYDWLIRGHGYSGGAANRRIQAARLLREIPEVAAHVESGSLNLTTLWQTQRAIRAQQKASGRKVTAAAKREALSKIAGKTSEAAERELHSLFPESERFVEKTIQKRDGGVGLSVQFSEEEMRELERAKELLSHAIPGASMAQIIVRLAREYNDRKDPLRKPHLAATPRRGIAQSRRSTIQKSDASCAFVDPVTKRVCGSRYQVEVDHIIPKAHGGTDDPSNLRCLCRKHNQWLAELKLGREFMKLQRGKRQRAPSTRQTSEPEL